MDFPACNSAIWLQRHKNMAGKEEDDLKEFDDSEENVEEENVEEEEVTAAEVLERLEEVNSSQI